MAQELQIEEKAKKPVEINLSFVTDREMQKINDKHRGVNHTTDILSFPMDGLEDSFPQLCLGDLVISVERTALQARARNHSFGVELKQLLVHGLLHLLGYEHKKSRTL